MSAPRDDDSEAIDRAFAELVAGYHLTADRPDPLPPVTADRESAGPPTGPGSNSPPTTSPPGSPTSPPTLAIGPTSAWADNHPLFVTPEPARVEPTREPDDRYVPDPQPPLQRPRLPILLAWAGIAYAAIVVLLAAFGVRLPPWMGWIALGGFLGGFGVLVFNLPRSRPPDAGDGAVL